MMMRKSVSFYRYTIRTIVLLALIVPLLLGSVFTASAAGRSSGAVYTITNASSGNEVLVFDRMPDGKLAFNAAYPTGGLGSGSGLGSQGALVLSKDHAWLFAVNAGSSDISVFAVLDQGLQLTDVEPSGGELPISLTSHGSLLYVLNAGGSGSIGGFSLSPAGDLSPLAGSTQPLSNAGAGAAPGPAQVSFTPDGSALVVTEKASNNILTYALAGGLAQPATIHPSAGMTPFGFDFNQRGVLVVSEAFGGSPGASALSSYTVSGSDLDLVSPSVGTTQTAACWVVIDPSGRIAYTTNTGSSSISSYNINRRGALRLIDPVAGFTGPGSAPIDMAFAGNGQFLYAISGGTNTISAFRALPDGSLTAIDLASVPAGSLGLAAR
jgi:6-phosphogluconolactonase (cycloisomerase 2 family)